MKERKMYYGITDFKPMLVNPTQDELSAFLGREVKFSPKYTFEKDGVSKLRIDVYGELPEGENSKTKLSVWCENRLDISKSGKQKQINGQGLTTYNTEKLPKHLHKASFRPSYVGEETLAMFLSKLLSWKVDLGKMKGNEVPNNFVDMQKIFNGDYSQLDQAVGKDRTVKVYVGVTSNKDFLESAVYPRIILSSFASNLNPIIDELNSQYGGFYGNIAPIQETFTLGVIGGSVVEPQEENIAPISAEDDDLPF